MTSPLNRLADECQLMVWVRQLSAWVGDGKPVTPKGVLRPSDVPAAATALAVSVPARIRTAADLEVTHRPWVAAQAVGFLKVTASRVVAAPVPDGDRLERWWRAVAAVLRAESYDERRRGAAVVCRMLLTALALDLATLNHRLAGLGHGRHLGGPGVMRAAG